MSSRRFLSTCLLALAVFVSVEVDAAGPLSEERLREGLSRMAPFVAGEMPPDARWVAWAGAGPGGLHGLQREGGLQPEGDGFVYGQQPGGEARLKHFATGDVVTLPGTGSPGTALREVKVAKDVAGAVKWLRESVPKPEADEDGGDEEDFLPGFGDVSNTDWAEVQVAALHWAALLFHTGEGAQALELARAALGDADEEARRMVLDRLFGQVADQRLAGAVAASATHRDWGRLGDELAALVNAFPVGWGRRDAVRVLLEQVRRRAAGPADPPLRTTIPLADADQQVLREWLEEREAGQPSSHRRWTLPLQEGGEAMAEGEAEAGFPGNRGLEAVPLLAALLADETLLFPAATDGSGSSSSYFERGYGDEDPEERLKQIYRDLPKPPSRSGFAWAALMPVLPEELQRADAESPAELIPDILAWHARVKDASPADLALDYVEAGERDPAVLALAATVTEPVKRTRLEVAMLERTEIWSVANLVPFVESLGPERGPGFVAKVREKLEGDMTRYLRGGEEEDRLRQQLERGLKRLDAAAKGEPTSRSLPEILSVLAAYDPEAGEADRDEVSAVYQELPDRLGRTGLAERVTTIVAALPDFKSPDLAAQMLGMAFGGARGGAPQSLEVPERQAVWEATRSHWRRLFDSVKDGETATERFGLFLQVVGRMEELHGGRPDFGAMQQLGWFGERGIGVLRERGEALLSGAEPQPLPNASTVGTEERERLLSEWGGRDAEAIRRGLETMPMAEVLALNEHLGTLPFEEIPPGFRVQVSSIQKVQADGTGDGTNWESWEGKPVDRDAVLELARKVADPARPGFVVVHLSRSAPLFGYSLMVREADAPTGSWEEERLATEVAQLPEPWPEGAVRGCSAALFQESGQLGWIWLDEPSPTPPAEPAEDGPWTKLREAEAKAWEQLSAALGAEGAVSAAHLVLVGAPLKLLSPDE
jgi:hypothetical protein